MFVLYVYVQNFYEIRKYFTYKCILKNEKHSTREYVCKAETVKIIFRKK